MFYINREHIFRSYKSKKMWKMTTFDTFLHLLNMDSAEMWYHPVPIQGEPLLLALPTFGVAESDSGLILRDRGLVIFYHTFQCISGLQ